MQSVGKEFRCTRRYEGNFRLWRVLGEISDVHEGMREITGPFGILEFLSMCGMDDIVQW